MHHGCAFQAYTRASQLVFACLLAAAIAVDVTADSGIDCITDVSTECGTTIEDITAGTGLQVYEYIPTVAPGNLDLEFTYTSGLIEQMGGLTAVETALEALSQKLCSEVDNAMGAAATDIELLYNLHHVTNFRPYPYGDSWFATSNGRNLQLDQRDAATGNNRYPPSMWNHIDIFLIPFPDDSLLAAAGLPGGARRAHYPHPCWEGGPDDGENPQNSSDVNVDNGVVIKTLPHAGNEWRGLPNLMHELGHMFGRTMSLSPIGFTDELWILEGGMGEEMRAEAARNAAGVPAFPGDFFGEDQPEDNRPEIPYGTSVQQGTIDDLANATARQQDYNRGRRWWPYLLEHFNGPSETSVLDDLAHQYLTTFVEGKEPGTGSIDPVTNLYMGTLATLLEQSHYDDEQLYPYFQQGGAPKSGEERLASLFMNYGIALAVNAPSLSVGEYGFPRNFVPTDHVPMFMDLKNGGNAASIPHEILITTADLNQTILLDDPVVIIDPVYEDLSMLLLNARPWAIDYLVFRMDESAAEGLREVDVEVIPEVAIYRDQETSFHHKISAAVVFYEDTLGEDLWTADERIVGIEHLEGWEVSPGDDFVHFSFTVPLYQGVRDALLVLTMAEMDMPERSDQRPPQAEQNPYTYHVEYTLKDVDLTMSNKSTETGLDFAGQPYSSIAFDYDGDDDELDDLFVASSSGAGSLHRETQINAFGVPEFTGVQPDRFGPLGDRPQSDLRGVSFADYDNDGDLDIFAGHNVAPRFYRNEGDGTFVNIADDVGIDTGPGQAVYDFVQCGTWGDYDGDGWVDLFLGRGFPYPGSDDYGAVQDRLLRNLSSISDNFVDVTASAGIDQTATEFDCTLTGAWADFDSDGDLDLFTPQVIDDLAAGPGAPTEGSHLYANQGDGTFVESSDNLFPDNIVLTNGASWVDLDADGDLDLVCAVDVEQWLSVRAFSNDQGTSFVDVTSDLGLEERFATAGITTGDVDLDGYPDLLVVPQDASLAPHLFVRRELGGIAGFVDFGAALGLEAASSGGVLANDFNRDGDLDLFIGRPVSSGKFFYQNKQDATTDAPANHWVAVEFPDVSCLDNRASLGAMVTLRIDGLPRQVQVADGGSGRGTQQPRRLVFGLGSEIPGLIQAHVRWPSGVETNTTLTADQTTTVNRGEIVPAIDESTVSAHYTPVPGGEADWVFEWRTDFAYDCGIDKVRMWSPAGAPGQCQLASTTYTSRSAGMQSTVELQPDGTYLHTFTVLGISCTPKCAYEYEVSTSYNETTFDTSAVHTLNTPVCAQ